MRNMERRIAPGTRTMARRRSWSDNDWVHGPTSVGWGVSVDILCESWNSVSKVRLRRRVTIRLLMRRVLDRALGSWDFWRDLSSLRIQSHHIMIEDFCFSHQCDRESRLPSDNSSNNDGNEFRMKFIATGRCPLQEKLPRQF